MDTKKPTDTLMASDGEQVTEDRVRRVAAILPSHKHSDGAGYDWMGPSLRRLYDDVLNEPVPDSFVELLKQLHDQQKKRL